MRDATIQGPTWLVCSCCGAMLRDTAEENAAHGQQPYPYDEGYGMCRRCGGDHRSRGTSELAVRRRLGWAGQMFYDARIKALDGKLSGPNLERFRRMSYSQKVAVIGRMVERGHMI